jgi:hypothetical protein
VSTRKKLAELVPVGLVPTGLEVTGPVSPRQRVTLSPCLLAKPPMAAQPQSLQFGLWKLGFSLGVDLEFFTR